MAQVPSGDWAPCPHHTHNDASVGFWAQEGAGVLLALLILIGQTGVLVDYQWTVTLGLQEIERVGTAVSSAMDPGFAFTGTFVYLLLIAGPIGSWLAKRWALLVLAAVLGITVY